MTRWHRALGIVSSVIVFATVVTGIALNHTDNLGLGRTFVKSALVNERYLVAPPPIDGGFRADVSWITQAGSAVFVDGTVFHQHARGLNGAARIDSELFVLFADQLIEFDKNFEVVDTYGALDGLAPPLGRLAVMSNRLVVEDAKQMLELDPRSGQWQPRADIGSTSWVLREPLPAAIRAQIAANYAGSVSYERLLLDLHSGRYFGLAGVILVDVAALAMLLLALSGVYMWFKFKRPGPSGARTTHRRPPP